MKLLDILDVVLGLPLWNGWGLYVLGAVLVLGGLAVEFGLATDLFSIGLSAVEGLALIGAGYMALVGDNSIDRVKAELEKRLGR